MNKVKELPSHTIQFYATAPYPCSYLPGLEGRSQVATPPNLMTNAIYDELIHKGFRRSGYFTYRPYCDHCKACISSRIITKEFKATRSQTRAWKKHTHLTSKVLPLIYSEEHFNLYRAYQLSRHTDSITSDSAETEPEEESQYRQFLAQSHIESFLVEFRENGVLRMVSVIDRVSDGISAVYTFFDASVPNASYGTYGILWQIDFAQSKDIPYVYLGYYIKESQKMSYKSNFTPIEGLIDGQWQLLKTETQSSEEEKQPLLFNPKIS